MRDTDTIRAIHQKRGSQGLPLERVYRHLFNPEFFLRAYGKIYRNAGAMTKGATQETVDGMSLQRIHNIIGLLRAERYQWTPVRRTEIPKANGKMRRLGIPTWSDKLVQEVLRLLLEPYYEQRFSDHSHGFRPLRSCHSALRSIQKRWKGTTWFIEGDIQGCFDNIGHATLLDIIRRDIHDGRLVQLIGGLLRAGYMEDWRYHDTTCGTPQGGILSPLLANVYLHELDKYVEDTLVPQYTRGSKRRLNPEYSRIWSAAYAARKRGDHEVAQRLTTEYRQLPTQDPFDPGYRRLRYVRYADDFLFGFAGPKKEAEEIRTAVGEYLGKALKLTLSAEKTLITHAQSDKAHFLGYEITKSQCNTYIGPDGKRAINGGIALLMPRSVVKKIRDRYSSKGKVIHKAELLVEQDYTILERFQGVLRGLYNYYCLATNVGNRNRMNAVKWILEQSLTKTLAHKHRCSVVEVYRRYQVPLQGTKVLRAVVWRPGKDPLVATFGGIPFVRNPEGLGIQDFRFENTWFLPTSPHSEVVQRLLADACELCGCTDLPVEVHHIRKLADIDRPGRRPKAPWEKIMAARKRKTLVVCVRCHDRITAGTYDGPSPRQESLESRMH
jgi:group II intron reverse transcriptase/maturase